MQKYEILLQNHLHILSQIVHIFQSHHVSTQFFSRTHPTVK